MPLDNTPSRPAPACEHCGQPAPQGKRFCCAGCAAAFDTIATLGLGAYYTQRVLNPRAPALRPEPAERWDLARAITHTTTGTNTLTLAIDGLQCGACVWLIESVLARQPGLQRGRVNMTTRRLSLTWTGAIENGQTYVETIERLGYRLMPFDAAALEASDDRTGRALIRALAVAGFAAGNVMLSSIGVWAGLMQGMGPATRDLLHWLSALIAMPAIAYAGMPFFRSAAAALRQGRTNMDVPISIGVTLVTAMSLVETIQGGDHAYFDSAISLVFFLLIGRVLDHRARGHVRAVAAQMLMLRCQDIAVLEPDGSTRRCPPEQIPPGATILVAPGERIGADGEILTGTAQIDTSLVTGESLPRTFRPGEKTFAGMVNLGDALTLRATATGAATLLAECVRLIEAAEARRGRFVVLADRIARRYAPTVHAAAALTFLWWWAVQGVPVGQALLTACAVLIITCPCALALAVPAVQVIATGSLFQRGILLKSATALERLAEVDTIVFDKTGTITEPLLTLRNPETIDPATIRRAASLAATSRHPLSRALVHAAGPVPPADSVHEIHGSGLACGDLRLGSAAFAGDPALPAIGPELWFAQPNQPPQRFTFDEQLRADAIPTLARLRAMGLDIHLLSGDRPEPVARAAQALGITQAKSAQTPAEKVAFVEALRAAGKRVLMVGDGLNDGPALAAASVSASPSTAADISQTVADIVFQGALLAPVADTIATARRARAVMRENIAFSIGYNALMLPLAVLGYVTPWLAAAAMSSSSLIVMLNSLRVRGSKP